MTHPLHSPEWQEARRLAGDFLEGYRFTGWTTANNLKLIAKAIENPGEKVQILDHFNSQAAHQHATYMLDGMVQQLQLQHMHIDKTDRGYFLTFEVRKGNTGLYRP